MADTDYDAPRVREGATPAPPVLEDLIGNTGRDTGTVVDVDETGPVTLAEANYLDYAQPDDPNPPGLAQQVDEFTCSRCFLILHRRRLARTVREKPVCRDCS